MSRFSGWTEAAVKKCNSNLQTNNAKIYAKKICVDYVGIIEKAITIILGLKCEREYKFLHDRRFRFDVAIPEKKIAIEFEGGVWTRGRHTRGKGYINDVKKYNLAVMHQWKLLRYTVENTKKIGWEISITDEVRKLIET